MQTFAEVQAASSAAYHTLGDLEWEVESTTVTHSSADWWDLLLEYFPWHRHQIVLRDQRLLVSHPKDTGKAG